MFKVDNYQLNLKYKGRKVVETSFSSDTPKTKEIITASVKKIQELVRKSKHPNADFMVALKFDSGWRTGEMFDNIEEPNFFDPDSFYTGIKANKERIPAQKTFHDFVIYTIPKAKPAGGIFYKNDCLFRCLMYAFDDDFSTLPPNWRAPNKIKEKLGLNREDMIPIALFKELEDGLKINLNCVGDYSYTSTGEHNRTINLILANEHYTIDKSKRHYNIPLNRKPVVFYEVINNEYHIISKSNEWNEPVDKSYLNIKYPQYYLMNMTKKTSNKTLKELFEEFNQAREEILRETNNFIDLYQTPNVKHACQKILFKYSASSIPPEPIQSQEADWLNKAFMGGLMYAEKGNFENTTCYDQNSMYSHYMGSDKFLVPYKQGVFSKVLNSDQKFYSYGIYRANIESNDESNNKYFRFNNKHHLYTHYDLSNAIKLGFTVELIQDDEANALLYSKDERMYGHHAYSKTIKYLFDLKTKCPYAKRILSCLWGSMVEKNKKLVVIRPDEEIKELDDDAIITTFIRSDSGCVKVQYLNASEIFKTNYARIGCFLTSYCRFQMSQFIRSNFENENVLRIHTDGVIVKDEKLNPNLLKKDIGLYKIEDEGNCNITNVNLIDWN